MRPQAEPAGREQRHKSDSIAIGLPGWYAGLTMPTRDELLARIGIDPQVCSGKPCIRGHRIWVSLILDFLTGGASFEEILAEYPQLEEADIRACIAYAAELARNGYLELPAEAS